MEMRLNFDCVSASVKRNQGMNCFCEMSERQCVMEELAASNQNNNYAVFAREACQIRFLQWRG